MTIPKNAICPNCKKHHRHLTIEVTRKKQKISLLCRADGHQQEPLGFIDDVQLVSHLNQPARKKRRLNDEDNDEQDKQEKKVHKQPWKLDTYIWNQPIVCGEEFIPVKVTQSFDKEDPMTFVDFEHVMRSFSPFPNFATAKECALKFINRVYAKVGPQKHFYKGNCTNELFVSRTLPNFSSLVVQYRVLKDGEQTVKSMYWSKLLECITVDLPQYVTVDIWPNYEGCPPRTFNLWPGFKAKLLKAGLEEIQQDTRLVTMQDFYKKIICSDDPSSYKYLMSILCSKFKNPGKKIEGIMFMSSGQGNGKNTCWEFLGDHILGKHLFVMRQGTELLTEQFNEHLEGKLIIVADELGASKDTFLPLWEKIKVLATSKTLSIRKLYAARYEVSNFTFPVVLSNNEMAVFVDSDDRRFGCLQVSDAQKGNLKYWSDLRATCFNDETGNLFFSWLCKTNEFNNIDARKLPKTELRRRVIENSLPSAYRFLEAESHTFTSMFPDYKERLERKEVKCVETETYERERWVSGSNLMKKIKTWAWEHNEKAVNVNKFGSQIIKYITKKRTRDGVFYDVSSFKPLAEMQ